MSRFFFIMFIPCMFTPICAQQTALAKLLIAELPELPLITQRKIIAQLPPQEQKKHTYPLFVHNAKLRYLLQNYFCNKSVKTLCSDSPILCFSLSPDGKYLACCKQGSGQNYIPEADLKLDYDTNNHIVLYQTTPFARKVVFSYPTPNNTYALSWSEDSTLLNVYCGMQKINFPISEEKSMYTYQIQRLFITHGKKDHLSWICGLYDCETCSMPTATNKLCTIEAHNNPYVPTITDYLYTTISAQFKNRIAKIAIVPQHQQTYDASRIILIKLPQRNLLKLTLVQLTILENFNAFKTSQTAIDMLPPLWQEKINQQLIQLRSKALQNAACKRAYIPQHDIVEPQEICSDLPYITKNSQAII